MQMTQELIAQKLDTLIDRVSETSQDIKEIRKEIANEFKEVRKDISELNVQYGKISTSVGWIRTLFTIAASLIILLLGVLIKLAL